MRKISVKQGAVCPLCPDHHDDEFVWSDVVQEPICLGCSYDIYYGLQFEKQPTTEEYNNSLTIERLLLHCGISFEEARRRHFAQIISTLYGKLKLLIRITDSGMGIAEAIENLHNEIHVTKAVMENFETISSEKSSL